MIGSELVHLRRRFMVSDLQPIESHLRHDEPLDLDADVVIRGWPLTIEGLLRNADATRRRYSFAGEPLIAVSAEIAVEDWTVEEILSGPRLRTRRTFATAFAGELVDAGFGLLPSFKAPHYSIQLMSYTESQAEQLIAVLGNTQPNPFFTRRSS